MVTFMAHYLAALTPWQLVWWITILQCSEVTESWIVILLNLSTLSERTSNACQPFISNLLRGQDGLNPPSQCLFQQWPFKANGWPICFVSLLLASYCPRLKPILVLVWHLCVTMNHSMNLTCHTEGWVKHCNENVDPWTCNACFLSVSVATKCSSVFPN